MEATTPELGPVGFWKLKSSSFSGSDSIVVEEAARNFLSPQPSINKSGAPKFSIQHDKVEDSRRTSSTTPFGIIFLLGMPFDRLVRGRISLRERAQ